MPLREEGKFPAFHFPNRIREPGPSRRILWNDFFFSRPNGAYSMPSQKTAAPAASQKDRSFKNPETAAIGIGIIPGFLTPAAAFFPAYLKNETKTPQGNFCQCTDPGQRKIPSYHSSCSLFKESRGYLRQAALFYPSGCTPYISRSLKRGRCTPFPAARCCWRLPEILSSPKERTAPS